MTDELAFDPLEALRILTERGVQFVVIGGFGAALLGSPVVTLDLDICYSRDEANLARLASALSDLDAKLRGPRVPDDLPSEPDERALALGDNFTFQTRVGPLDVLAAPSGTLGFPDLEGGAVMLEIGGFAVRIASIDDLIRMKTAAGRAKDEFGLIHLRALRRRLEERER